MKEYVCFTCEEVVALSREGACPICHGQNLERIHSFASHAHEMTGIERPQRGEAA